MFGFSRLIALLRKHANTTTTSNPAYPNKRPAAVLTAQKVAIRPSSSTETSQSESTVRKSAWAPIPKVVPPPPPVAKEPEPEEMETETEPAAKTPSPKQQQRPTANAITIQKKDDKPALPAAASWGRGVNNNQTMASSVESATTPINFGPSLSDAAAAPQKPKHASPSIPRKKEKKLKSKMVRLEEFEEGVRTGKAVSSKAKSKKTRQRQEQEESQTLSEKPRVVEMSADVGASQSTEDEETRKKAPSIDSVEDETQAPASNVPAESTSSTENVEESAETTENKEVMEDIRSEVRPQTEDKEEPEREREETVEFAKPDDSAEDHQNDQNDGSQMQPITVEERDQGDDSKNDYTTEQPSFANYILGDLLMDQVEEDSSDLYEAQGGLSSLKSDIGSESDPRFDQDFVNDEAFEMERSEKIQEEDHIEFAPSPMLMVDRVNTLDDQELESPERLERQLFNHPPQAINNLPNAMEGQGRPPMGPHGHPPGLGVPVGWQSQQAFDPFFGQDPNIIAARRLQHSQRMLEASGLFHGFGRPAPPPPPPPPPVYGISPNINASGTPPMPRRNPGPPPGFFGPPPQHPQAPMMQRPTFVHPPPGMESRAMESLENGMQGLNLYRQNNEEGRMREDTVRSMQEDFRAMLPNVKISFGPLRDEHFNRAMSNSPQFANKPHTPSEEEEDSFSKQLRSNSTANTAHNYQDPTSIVNSQQIHGAAESQEKISNEAMAVSRRQERILMQKPNANTDEYQHANTEKDVKEEARHFFGEFLRKAAASSEAQGGKEVANNDCKLLVERKYLLVI